MNKVAYILVIIGALNWGLYGAIGLDLVDLLVGTWPIVAKLVYVLVGLSAVWLLVAKKGSKSASAPSSSAM